MNRAKINNIILSVILTLLIILAISNLISDFSLSFLKETSGLALKNLGIVAGLKVISATLPLLKGFSDIIGKILDFLLIVNGLILLQIALIKISKVIVLKILMVCLFGLTFIKKARLIALRVLVVLLFINPGLSLYILTVKSVSKAAKLDSGEEITRRLESIGSLSGEELEDMSREGSDDRERVVDTRQGMDIFSKFGEYIKDKTTDTGSFISKQLDMAKSYLSQLLENLFKATINYFITVLVLFLVLPVVYFYILYLLMKRIFANITNVT